MGPYMCGRRRERSLLLIPALLVALHVWAGYVVSAFLTPRLVKRKPLVATVERCRSGARYVTARARWLPGSTCAGAGTRTTTLALSILYSTLWDSEEEEEFEDDYEADSYQYMDTDSDDLSNFETESEDVASSSNDDETMEADERMLLDFSIDSFLRGEYDGQFAEDAPAPHPGLNPRATVESALQSLRKLDDPEPFHGAAILQRFLVPLSRGERWGDSSSARVEGPPGWKEVLRGSLTPSMLGRRLRASQFSCLLDWESLDVTEGAYSIARDDGIEMGVPSTVAFVNAALYFGKGLEPILVQFQLRKIHGVWLIDTATIKETELFVDKEVGQILKDE